MCVILKLLSTRRDADAGLVPAPLGATGEALPAQEGPDGLLRLATVRPGEKVRDPAVPVHTGEGGAGHGAQPVRDAGGSAHARTHTRPHKNEIDGFKKKNMI